MATPMDDEQRRAFLSDGTRTATVSTVRADGRPHAAPVWFVLDGDDLLFMTGAAAVKGRNLARVPTVVLSVDDGAPPYSFVTIEGAAELSDDLDAMLPWSIAIGTRYMGAEQGEQFGRRNAVAGELLVRVRPRHTVALAALAD